MATLQFRSGSTDTWCYLAAGSLVRGVHTVRHLWDGLHHHLRRMHCVADAGLLDGERLSMAVQCAPLLIEFRLFLSPSLA